jgi:hypothetical protein
MSVSAAESVFADPGLDASTARAVENVTNENVRMQKATRTSVQRVMRISLGGTMEREGAAYERKMREKHLFSREKPGNFDYAT